MRMQQYITESIQPDPSITLTLAHSRHLQQPTVFVSNLRNLIKRLQLFPACFIYTPFGALSIFVALSNFYHLIELLSFSHPLLFIHFLRYLRTL